MNSFAKAYPSIFLANRGGRLDLFSRELAHSVLDVIRCIDKYQYMTIRNAASAFKALAHPHRLEIFLRLSKCCQRHDCDAEACARLCVGELGKGLGIGQPTVSHHLKELTRAGLIRTVKCGQSTECWVAETTLDDLAQFFLKAKKLKAVAR